jgi:hypothetical protein
VSRHYHQAIDRGQRPRLPQLRVGDAEHGGHGGDAERQRQRRPQGEAGFPPQPARGVADVAPETVDGLDAPHRARILTRQRLVAEGAPADHLAMEGHLFGQLRLVAAAMQPVGDPPYGPSRDLPHSHR